MMAKSRVVSAIGIVAAVVGGMAGVLAAQASNKPAFEVASIKQNKSGSLVVRIGIQPGGRFEASNYTLSELIRWAYSLDSNSIEGGPSWIAQDRFDVLAKASEDMPSVETMMRPMVQTLLADRFKLGVHRESRERPVYALVVSRSDRKLGPQLRRADIDCSADPVVARASSSQPAAGQSAVGCGLVMRPGQGLSGQMPIAQLASALFRFVQRKVIDRTGLDGTYALTLSFTPDPGVPQAALADQNAGSIFTALQEQLGLKLESRREPMDVLVIDHVEQPTPN